MRKPTPVTIPEKSGHYLKKSPSPTEHRSPPGEATDGGGQSSDTAVSPLNECSQKDMIITPQQVDYVILLKAQAAIIILIALKQLCLS